MLYNVRSIITLAFTSKSFTCNSKAAGFVIPLIVKSPVILYNPLSRIITEVNTNGKFEIELRIGVGKGYVPSEENELPNAPIGTLAMDSIFNPVTKVTYNVQPVPGAKDPIEILSVEVETDGSVTPQDLSLIHI